MAKFIGEILVEKNLVTEEQLQTALSEQQQTKEFLGTILIRRSFISEEDLLKVLSEQFDMPYRVLKNKYLDLALGKQFSSSLIFDHKCFPVEQNEESVTVAVIDPLDVVTISEAERKVFPRKLKALLTSPEDMDDVLKRYRQYMVRELTDKTK